MVDVISGNTENQTLKKRGRKSKKDNYFDVREETAVIDFINSNNEQERNKIYNEYLRAPLDKMISSIIRRYKLYRKEMDFEEVHNDTHSFLMTKVEKFKPSKNKKAYSYFGTICKNYLMGQIMKDQKEINRKISYDDISPSLEERPDMVYTIDGDLPNPEDILMEYSKYLKKFMEEEELNDSEIKLGIALIDIFDNYKTIFLASDNNKFNKNMILLSIREMTNLSTKEIRFTIRKFKKLYVFVQGIIHE
jgi:hypothetical protein